jgi:hypothetical protein
MEIFGHQTEKDGFDRNKRPNQNGNPKRKNLGNKRPNQNGNPKRKNLGNKRPNQN